MARADKVGEGFGGGGGTRITFNANRTKVIKIDPEGNMTSRPVKSAGNMKVSYETSNGKTVEKGIMQVPKSLPKGTQAGHTVTKVNRKSGRSE